MPCFAFHYNYYANFALPREKTGEYIEVSVLSDDLKTQTGPLISPDLYREMLEPFVNDTARLKREYGRDSVFWVAFDPQSILPFSDDKEVAEEVNRHIEDLAPGGGFVFAPIHNIQAWVTPENIVTMYRTALEYERY